MLRRNQYSEVPAVGGEWSSVVLPTASVPTDDAVRRAFPVALPRYKRPFDLIVGSILLTLSAPVAAIVAAMVKSTSSGPVLFKQERLGLHSRPFTLYKFRTMYRGAPSAMHEEYFKQYLQGEPAPGQERAIYKLRHDPRITPVGGVLRRLGLDELPQLFNVITGDMSLVGPRPPLAYEVAQYTPRHMRRLDTKPGCTGLWQVRGRDMVHFEAMIDMDLEYIERQTILFDLRLCLLTVPALVWAFCKH